LRAIVTQTLRTRRRIGRATRSLAGVCLALALAGAGTAEAASLFYISGGGDGHGIGMSQYGAYGYALHGANYRWILAHYYQHTSLGVLRQSPVVRVLLATGSASFRGASRVGAANKKLNSSSAYSVRPVSGGFLGLYDSRGKKVGTFTAPLDVSGTGPTDLLGHGLYRGALEFRPSGGGVQTVNAVDLEDYVRGVVSAEMPSGWSMEALKAQAVAARTYAITSNVSGNGYQLYPDTRSQMYGGVAAETASTNSAVAATSRQVVTYGGRPVTTFFFSSSGGHTEDIQNVWLGSTPEPWLVGVADPYDNAGGNPDYHWSHNMGIASAAARLGPLVKGRLIGINITKRGVSPRVVSAQVVGTGGKTTVSGPQLQQIFGLMSTYMSFSTISSSATNPASGSPTGGAVAAARDFLTHSGLASSATGVQALVAPSLPWPRLHGSLFPAPAHAQVAIQRLSGSSWHTVGHAGLSRGGGYSVPVTRSGLYRVAWRGLDGPAITVR
jgi:stage II sporulation protein D